MIVSFTGSPMFHKNLRWDICGLSFVHINVEISVYIFSVEVTDSALTCGREEGNHIYLKKYTLLTPVSYCQWHLTFLFHTEAK